MEVLLKLEALRLKMQRDNLDQSKIDAIRSAITQSVNSGKATHFDMQKIIEEARKESGLNA
jgi:hypothetical protein